MKLIILFLTICCLHVAAASFAQQITLSEKDAPLEKVFKDITKQTGYIFFTEKNTLQGTNKVTLTLNNASLNETLQKVFAGQPLEYTMAGTTIAVKKKEIAPTPSKKFAEPLTPPTDIIGRVTNPQGQPMNGASVVVKRTSSGVLTDANGNFVLKGIYPTDTLVVSYIGYGRQYFPVGKETSLKIVLKETTNQLDQVVIQAYGETSQRLATGDIGTVRAAEIAKHPVMNVLEALQGQVPGAVVTNTSGYASGQVKVEIRGRNTINPLFPSDPLYIIDGVPLSILDVTNNASYGTGAPGFIQSSLDSYAGGQSPLFSLDPSNIESIQVLKDADATAIYGSRGANGVILITTKKGKVGKSSLELNAYQGETFISRQYPMANTQQYNAMRREALRNDGYPVDNYYAPDLFFGDSTRNTNWQKYIAGKLGTSADVNAGFSGGNATTTYRISASYQYQRDMTAVSGGNNRAAFALNLNHRSPNQRLSLGLTANYSYSVTNQISTPGNPNMAPDAPPVYDNNGRINYAGWNQFYGTVNANPFGSILQPYRSGTNFLNSNLLVSYEIVKGLEFRTSLGYNTALSNQNNLQPMASQDPASSPPLAIHRIGTSTNQNIIVEPQLEWKTYLGAGKIDVLAGGTAQKTLTSGTLITGRGFPDDALIDQMAAAPLKQYFYSDGQYRYSGIFGRLNYNLKDRYIINITLRRDGSSRFGPGKQYGNFGSLGGAWIFSEENWMKQNMPFISFAKIRASYGLTGGDQVGDYAYLTQWTFSQFPYNGVLPLTPNKHTDSLFHWQTNKKLEVGIDLSFFKDWVSLGASGYIDRCNDQLLPFPTAIFTGFNSVVTNTPANVQNSGLEFNLQTKIVDGKNLKVSIRGSIGINRNKLVSYPDIAQSPYNGIYKIGQSLSIRRLLHSTGVDPQTGLYTFEDKNKDGKITFDPSGRTTDDTYGVDMSPKFDGSINLNVSYKNWSLSTLFYFRKQLALRPEFSLDVPGDETNQPLEILQNHWTQPGQIAEYAKFTTNPSDISWSNHSNSDGVITDASFIRMQNISLSYSLLGSRWKVKGINNIQVVVRGQNLFLITKYKGSDPEIASFSSLPLPKIVTAGLNFNF